MGLLSKQNKVLATDLKEVKMYKLPDKELKVCFQEGQNFKKDQKNNLMK